MRTITEVKTLYKFQELSEEAKEKVRQWYLDGQDSETFTQMCLESLKDIFPNSDLKVQYSLNHCQGDGFNIFGELNINDFIENSKEQLTDTQVDILKKVEKGFSSCIELPENKSRYCYCCASDINFADDVIDWMQYNDIDDEESYENLEDIKNVIANFMKERCKAFENNGYSYFYEISDEDLEEACDCNDYEFLEDGTFY